MADPLGVLGMHGGPPFEGRNVGLVNSPVIAQHPVEVQALVLSVAHPDHDGRMLRHQPEAFFGLAELLRGGLVDDREGELARDRVRQTHFILGEGVRLGIVGHEFADQPPVGDQRDEGQRPDSFGLDRLLQRVRLVGEIDVADADRHGIPVVRLPGRVAVDRFSIGVRQASPCDEPHDAGGIEQQNRRPIAAERIADRVERGRIDGVEGFCRMQPLGKLKEARQFTHALGEGRLKLLPLRDLATDGRRADDAPLGVGDRRDGQLDVDEAAVLPNSHGLVLPVPRALPDGSHDGVCGFMPFGTNELQERLPDDLVCSIAEELFGRRIPPDDDPVRVPAPDCVSGPFQDRLEADAIHLEPRASLLGVPQRLAALRRREVFGFRLEPRPALRRFRDLRPPAYLLRCRHEPAFRNRLSAPFLRT